MEYKKIIKNAVYASCLILELSSIIYIILTVFNFNLLDFIKITELIKEYFSIFPKWSIFLFFISIYWSSFILILPMLLFLNYYKLNGLLETTDINRKRFITQDPVNPPLTMLYYSIVSIFFIMHILYYIVLFEALNLIYSNIFSIILIVIIFSLEIMIKYIKRNKDILVNKIISSFISALFIAFTYIITSAFGFEITEASLTAIFTALILGLLGFTA